MLTENRNTPARDGSVLSVPVKAGIRIMAGVIVAIDNNGFAIRGGSSPSAFGIGRAESEADNSSGDDGDITIAVRKGVFRYDNDGTIKRKHIGQSADMVDDHTVGMPKSNENAIGYGGDIFDVDPEGVWVRFL